MSSETSEAGRTKHDAGGVKVRSEEKGVVNEVNELMRERERELRSALSGSRTDFLEQRCYSCGMSMVVGKGDTLYAGKWYHGDCWTAGGARSARKELIALIDVDDDKKRKIRINTGPA